MGRQTADTYNYTQNTCAHVHAHEVREGPGTDVHTLRQTRAKTERRPRAERGAKTREGSQKSQADASCSSNTATEGPPSLASFWGEPASHSVPSSFSLSLVPCPASICAQLAAPCQHRRQTPVRQAVPKEFTTKNEEAGAYPRPLVLPACVGRCSFLRLSFAACSTALMPNPRLLRLTSSPQRLLVQHCQPGRSLCPPRLTLSPPCLPLLPGSGSPS